MLWTPARPSGVRAGRMHGKVLSNTEKHQEKLKELAKMDTDRIRSKLSKTLSPQTVKQLWHCSGIPSIMVLARRHIQPLHFKIAMPLVDNTVTEDFNRQQIKRLLEVLETTRHRQVADIIKIASFSSMGRMEALSLR